MSFTGAGRAVRRQGGRERRQAAGRRQAGGRVRKAAARQRREVRAQRAGGGEAAVIVPAAQKECGRGA